MNDLPIVAAGRDVPDAVDRIRRYCGLPWSGGPPETWAWHYYDTVPADPDDEANAVDVLAAAALHPGLSRSDLAYFRDERDAIGAWLAGLPAGVKLGEATDTDVDHLVSMPRALTGASPALLSKVLHRKRPLLLPLVDRHLLDWYRPVTGERTAAQAWEPLVRTMRDEQRDDESRLFMSILLQGLEEELWPRADAENRPRLSWLRAVDIAIWMGRR